MMNLKHTIMSVVSIALVGTLSFFQVSDLAAQTLERNMKLGTGNIIDSIIIEATEKEETVDETSEETPEDLTNEEKEQAIAEKSSLVSGYAKVTGTTDLKAAPGDGAETIGTMSGADTLEILESTEGWYKVFVNGQSGYVKQSFVTLNKTEAETAAKQLDYYKRGKVTSSTGVTVRTSGDTNSASLGIINEGEDVVIVDTQNDYIKILFGSDLTEGYVINYGIECTGEWVTKDEIHSQIKKIAAEKEEAARKAEAEKKAAAEKEAARLAAMGYSKSETSTKTKSAPATSSSGKGQAIVNTAKQYLGVPYVWGGTSPKGFDCSGLVQYVYSKNGISLPRVAASQRNAGTYVSRANLQPGDLVFFSSGGRISHVGIYIGNGNMIHAPQTGDVVKVSSINSSYRVRSYAGAVRPW